ncbi:MAG: hypothetical protein Q4P71_01325 [Actinomycetaceae bacterium]|nr:hypothetical protein [Actinomycetaceae bacterium]
MGLFDRFRGVARSGSRRSKAAALDERYADKPQLRFLDAYVLDALGVLDDITADQMVELSPRLAHMYEVDEGPWQRVLEQAFSLAPNVRETILNEWGFQLEEAVSKGARLNEVDFAQAVADSIAEEDAADPLDFDLVVKPVEANADMVDALRRAHVRAADMGATASGEELQSVFISQRNAWYHTPEDQRETPDAVIEALAVAAGEMIRESTNTHWVIYSYGDDAVEFGLTDARHERLYKIVESVHERWMLWNDTGLDEYVDGTIRSLTKAAEHTQNDPDAS